MIETDFAYDQMIAAIEGDDSESADYWYDQMIGAINEEVEE